MILSLGLFQQGLIIAALVTVSIALLCRFVFPMIQGKLQLFPARLQANIILFICFLPLLMIIFALVISFLPALLNILGFGPEHCDIHTNNHSHLCSVHPPLPIGHWLTWLSGLFSLVLITGMVVLIRDFMRSYRFGRRFSKAGQVSLKQNVWLVDSHIPFAFVTGLIRTKIIISTALKQNLSRRQLDIVLAHEGDHKKYYDVLRQTVARAVSLLHFPGLRRRLLTQLSLATEKACDETAAIKSGSPVDVAETLVAIERLYRGDFSTTGNVALGVVGNTVVERVETLLAETKPQPFHANWLFGILAIIIITASLNYNQLHHLVETFLSYITH